MVTAETTLTCEATGLPAHVEVRMGLGAGWQGSRYDGSVFVVVDHAVKDGAYSDSEVARMLERGALVEYGDAVEGNKPAAEIGIQAATELFLLGASEVDRAVADGGHDGAVSRALRPVSLAFLGQARYAQGADFVSYGRLWALVERARGLKPFEDLDANEVARQTYLDVVAFEASPGDVPPEPRRLH